MTPKIPFSIGVFTKIYTKRQTNLKTKKTGQLKNKEKTDQLKNKEKTDQLKNKEKDRPT